MTNQYTNIPPSRLQGSSGARYSSRSSCTLLQKNFSIRSWHKSRDKTHVMSTPYQLSQVYNHELSPTPRNSSSQNILEFEHDEDLAMEGLEEGEFIPPSQSVNRTLFGSKTVTEKPQESLSAPTQYNQAPGILNSAYNTNASIPETLADIIQKVKDILINEALPAATQNLKDSVLDMISILRDYFQTGQVQSQNTIISKQIKTLDAMIQEQRRTTKNSVYVTDPTSRSSTSTNPTNRTIPKNPTMAQAAANGNPKQTTQQWQTITKKTTSNKKASENNYRSKQLVLIRTEEQKIQYPTIDSIRIREHINSAFASKGTPQGVVSTAIVSIHSGNIVITTLPDFSGQFLEEHQNLWTSNFPTPYNKLQVNKPWHKVAIHGIPLKLTHTQDILGSVAEELHIFNKLTILNTSHWLTSLEKRESGTQLAGSIVVAFETSEEAERAINNRVSIFGVSCKAEPMHSTPPKYQCQRCQQYGHSELRCRAPSICRICAELHHTTTHHCNECNTRGKACIHTIPKCANCQGAHRAGTNGCPVYLAIHKKVAADTSALVDV